MPVKTSAQTNQPHAADDPAGRRAPASAAFSYRHLLGLHGVSARDIKAVLSLARRYAGHDADGSEDPAAWRSVLRGRVVANLFFEDSTRTRVSFSVAAKRLGAEVIDLTAMGSSVSKGETVADTALNVAAMGVDALVMRHASSGAPQLVVRALESRVGAWDPDGGVPSVINAGDGKHEHPTQGLLDAYTIAESFSRLDGFDLSGLKVGIVGDIASSRVARSNLACLAALGAQVYFVGPPTLVPAAFEKMGARIVHDIDAVIGELDAVNVLRIQFERHGAGGGAAGHGVAAPGAKTPSNVIASVREYHERYGLHAARLAQLKKGAIVMHPGPINRGVEMTVNAADDKRSVVLRQVRHGVAVRMAALELCIGAR
ncbi:MAG TPA: aspartate carbamoyltransferase catalytic subunit [Phycisphaerales bacterium]|nr:aspartate carbamoyltransferase catalytic subunit [Phycisphaerales bacterium]